MRHALSRLQALSSVRHLTGAHLVLCTTITLLSLTALGCLAHSAGSKFVSHVCDAQNVREGHFTAGEPGLLPQCSPGGSMSMKHAFANEKASVSGDAINGAVHSAPSPLSKTARSAPSTNESTSSVTSQASASTAPAPSSTSSGTSQASTSTAPAPCGTCSATSQVMASNTLAETMKRVPTSAFDVRRAEGPMMAPEPTSFARPQARRRNRPEARR